MTIKEARYFPTIIDLVETGRVSRISIVPLFHSSVSSRIVVAGISISNTNGASVKKFSRLTYPKSRILKLEKKNKKSPFSNRNSRIAR